MDNVSSNDAFLDMARIAVVEAGCEWDGLQMPFNTCDLEPAQIHFYHRPTKMHLNVPVNLLLDNRDWITQKIQEEITGQKQPNKRSTMTDTSKLNLRQKLIQVYNEIDHVEKAGRNEKQKYDFVRAADVLRSIRNAFAKFGIYAETNYDLLGTYDIKTNNGGTMHTATVKAFIRLMDADSDETLNISGLGDGADSGDKGIFKAQTGATKNALRNGTLLPDAADPYAMDPEADQSVDNATDFSTSSRYQPQEPEFREDQHAAPNPLPAPRAQKPADRPAGPPAESIDAPLAPPPPSVPVEEQNQGPDVAPEHGDAYEGPDDELPTEEELAAYRTKFKNLGDDLTANGKLKASKGLPVNRKLLVFLLSITKASDATKISRIQWDDFFARVDQALALENGLVNLGKLVNKFNGLEEKQ
jgi:hypothetical protein